jgi:MerR family transcriptional regulator, heat shock protein HspR
MAPADDEKGSEAPMGLGRLDDEDYPAFTMGQAAELLGAQPAFLRSLDAAGVLKPERSGGGHRRYSRRQLNLAARMRALFDEGLTLEAAARIVDLQDDLATAQDDLAAAQDDLATAQDDLATAQAKIAELEDATPHSGTEHSAARDASDRA